LWISGSSGIGEGILKVKYPRHIFHIRSKTMIAFFTCLLLKRNRRAMLPQPYGLI
jgi:hypothetical protein